MSERVRCHNRCKCSIYEETTRSSVKVMLGIKFMKLVESLIGLEVTKLAKGQKVILHSWEGYILLNKIQWSQQFEHKRVTKRGTEPGVRKVKRSLPACHNHWKCSIETNRSSVKVTLGIKVMKFLESLIGLEVTIAGQGSKCHLTFVRVMHHISEQDPRIDHRPALRIKHFYKK